MKGKRGQYSWRGRFGVRVRVEILDSEKSWFEDRGKYWRGWESGGFSVKAEDSFRYVLFEIGWINLKREDVVGQQREEKGIVWFRGLFFF